jgi:protein-S-isoprenylcysteine O-methyltransferase Ste14
MAPIALFTVELVLEILLSWWVVRRDVERLEPPESDRAWPPASFWSAIVVFAPLCVFVHFVKTRRSLKGVALGLAWTAAVVVVVDVTSACCAWLLGAA